MVDEDYAFRYRLLWGVVALFAVTISLFLGFQWEDLTRQELALIATCSVCFTLLVCLAFSNQKRLHRLRQDLDKAMREGFKKHEKNQH